MSQQEYRGGLPVTGEQAKIVDNVVTQRFTAAMAGAGTGKTWTTVATALELIQNHHAQINQFILITFTNDAARELRVRLKKALKERLEQASTPQQRQLWRTQLERLGNAYIGTIHGFCRQEILKGYGHEQGIARDAGVTFSSRLLSDAFHDVVAECPSASFAQLRADSRLELYQLLKLVVDILEDARNRGIPAAEIVRLTAQQPASGDPGQPYRLAMAELVHDVERQYERLKNEKQVIDAHDLLEKTAELLQSANKDRIVAGICQQFRYLFIDEFQDTDIQQKRMVDALQPVSGGGMHRLLVVGDSKQEIYGFRGANRLLKQIATERHVNVLDLSISYRMTKRLLEVQRALFQAIGSMDPSLNDFCNVLQYHQNMPDPAYPSRSLVYKVATKDNLESRIQATAEGLERLLQGTSPSLIEIEPGHPVPVENGHIAILVRSNWQLEAYLKGLRDRGFNVQAEAGESFYNRPEVIAVYRLLYLLLHSPSDAALTLALDDTPQLANVDAEERIREALVYKPHDHAHPDAEIKCFLTNWLMTRRPDLEDKLIKLREHVRTDIVPQLLKRLYDAFEVKEYYAQQNDVNAMENLERLRDIARGLFNDDEALTLRSFVSWLQMAIITGRKEEGMQPLEAPAGFPPYIRIMTVHQAKGLEFPIVIIPEIQQRLDDVMRAPEFLLDGHGLEVNLRVTGLDTTFSPAIVHAIQAKRVSMLVEEMRVFYVAVTRAKHAVFLVGSGDDPPKQFPDEGYSWQDALLSVWPALPPWAVKTRSASL